MKNLFLTLLFLFFSFAFFAQETPLDAQQKRTAIIEYAKTFIGTPYKYGGTSRSGMDCSGFIFTVVKDSIGMSMPRTSTQLYAFATPISRDQLEPGDLVFFKPASSNSVTHVGIYTGRNQMIHAASDGPNTGVILSSLSENYWSRTYYSSGRFLPSSQASGEQYAKDSESESRQTNQDITTSDASSVRVNTFKNVSFLTAANGAWFFFDAKGFNPRVTGFNIYGGALFNEKMSLTAGIRYDSNFEQLSFPLLLGIGLKNNFWLMVGISPIPEAHIDIPFYMGISWNRELYSNKNLKLYFTQDFSYTAYDINDFSQWFSYAPEKMNFSTGLKVTFPNS